MRELGREFVEIFRHWFVGAVVLTVALAISGAAFVPNADASFGEKVVAALGGAVVGLTVVALLVLVVALVRVPVSDYRERHRLRRVGQECLDIAYAMLEASTLKPCAKAEGRIEFLDDDTETQVLSNYSLKLSARVFRASRELERLDVINREQRENMSATPEGVVPYYDKLDLLLDLGNRLGGNHPDLDKRPSLF